MGEVHRDVVIIGAGLAGLTAAYHIKRLEPSRDVLVIERSGTAGGLTGNWIDHRWGDGHKLQPPMHMIFRDKYPNLISLINEVGGHISELFPGFTIVTSDGVRHRLELNDWTARNLPAPLHALGMFAKLKMPLTAKWDLAKLASVSAHCARELIEGKQEPQLVPNTMSLESLEVILNMGARARDFVESVTPSIYNLHPWYTSAPRMAAVMAGTLVANRDSLKYHVFSKNYNAAFIDDFVHLLRNMGVEFSFWTEARRIDGTSDQVDSVWCRTAGPESSDSHRYVCDGCGAENFAADRAFCTRCGRDRTLQMIRSGKIKTPAAGDLWADPAHSGCRQIRCKSLVTAMYPHMIAKLIPTDSSLRAHPYVRACFSSRGKQTRLSIGRVYYRKSVTDDKHITGLHNPTYAFNGCQSVMNVFGPDDLGYSGGDVIDVLLDVGVIRDAHSAAEQKQRIIRDLSRAYPDADPSAVEHVSFADMQPDVLYHSEQPAIAGLHRIFNTNRAGPNNWYVAGCHSGTIGIGMESAVQSGMSAANCLLGDGASNSRVDIIPYKVAVGSRLLATFGRGLMLWRNRGRTVRRRAGSDYSEADS
jgi:hypothetical protein